MSGRSTSYRETLLEALQDKDEAMHYLQAGLEESPSVFLTCVKNVIESRSQAGGAGDDTVGRVAVHQVLQEEQTLTLDGAEKILHKLGFRLTICLDQDMSGDSIQRVDPPVNTESFA